MNTQTRRQGGIQEGEESNTDLADCARFRPGLSICLLVTVSGYLVGRLFFLIDRYSVNVPVWDQFDFYFLLSDLPQRTSGKVPFHPSLWRLFDSQFGPHRLGVGLVVSKYLAILTHWNFRAETFLIGALLCAAAATAVVLKRRLFGPMQWHDAAIPLLMLTAAQYEIWSGTPDSSHGAFPLLFVMLYCLAWTWRQAAVKYIASLILNFLSIFTGFGVFLGGVTILLFSLRLGRSLILRRWKDAWLFLGMLAIAGGSMGLFFRRYTFNPANPTFHFPDPNWPLYPDMAAIAFARSVGFMHRGIADGIGWILLLAAIAGLLCHGRRASDPHLTRSLVIVALLSFTLFFTIDMVVGRISLGVDTIQASRYVPLMMPGLLGIYFAALAIDDGGWRRIAVFAVLILAVFSGLIVKDRDLHAMQRSAAGKVAWVWAYLQTGRLDTAAQAADAADPGFTIYPTPAGTHLETKLAYLRAKNLSFFHTGRPQ